jgi:16S rRNA C1402 (ribose-2'-O) methylase RsmI
MTKVHEEYAVLPIEQAREWAEQHPHLKGEVAVVLHLSDQACALGQVAEGVTLEEMVSTFFAGGGTLREGLRQFRDCGLSRQELYSFLLSHRVK